MELLFIADFTLLADSILESSLSPEDFLLTLEDMLDSGELTLDEVQCLIRDYNQS